MTEPRARVLRCPSTTWGVAEAGAEGRYTVRCRGKYCRTVGDGTVMHTFDLATGSFETRLAADEPVRAEEPTHAGNTAI